MPDDVPDFSAALGAAIEKEIAGRYRKDVAAAVGVPPSTVTRWIQGEVRPSLEQLRLIERYCDLAAGRLLYAAGYLTPAVTVSDAIKTDPKLNETGRFFVAQAYESALALARAGDEAAEASNHREHLS